MKGFSRGFWTIFVFGSSHVLKDASLQAFQLNIKTIRSPWRRSIVFQGFGGELLGSSVTGKFHTTCYQSSQQQEQQQEQQQIKSFENFLEWSSSRMIFPHGIKVDVKNGRRGIFATEDIPKDESLLEVPDWLFSFFSTSSVADLPNGWESDVNPQDGRPFYFNCEDRTLTLSKPVQELTYPNDLKSPIPGISLESWESFPWMWTLALRILVEQKKGSESPVLPYLAVLPKRHGTSVMRFTDEQLAEMQYPPLVARVAAARADCAALRAALGPVAAAAVGLSPASTADLAAADGQWGLGGEEALLWALETASSRAVGETADMSGPATMVPWHDMFNHGDAAGRLALRYNAAQRSYSFFTPRRAWSRGEEVLLSYGEKSNDDLLLSYYFCIPDNPDDVFEVPDLAAIFAAALPQVSAARVDALMRSPAPLAPASPPRRRAATLSPARAAEEAADDDAAAVADAAVAAAVGEEQGKGAAGAAPRRNRVGVAGRLRRGGLDADSLARVCLALAPPRELLAAWSAPPAQAATAYLDCLSTPPPDRASDRDPAASAGADKAVLAAARRLRGETVAAGHAAVARICQLLLDRMPTSLAHDLALQAAAEAGVAATAGEEGGERAGEAAARRGLALDFRVGKKRLLATCADEARRRARAPRRIPTRL